MKKRNCFLTLTIAGLFLLTGCGAKKDSPLTAQTDTIIVTQEEGIIGYIYEKFDESLYNFEDLDALVREQVEYYNEQDGAGGIEIRECTLDGENARISLCYETGSDYELFNAVIFRCGETLDSLKEEFALADDLIFVDARDKGKRKTLAELAGDRSYQIILTEDDSNIRILGQKIRYIMQGDTLVGESEVDTADGAAFHIVIYSRGD